MDNSKWCGEILRAAIPQGRDPMINTPLLSLGKGGDGEERFWISSWNRNSGCLGILVSESGKERIYRFAPPNYGFYSAVSEDDDTLWLCGDLSRVVRLTLSTGEMETFDTGAPSALVFSGMVLDPDSGKLFAAAYPPPITTAFSFDYRNRKPVRVYPDVCKEHYMRTSFANGDGTYSCLLDIPDDIALLQWNPDMETVEKITLGEIAVNVPPESKKNEGIKRLIGSDEGLRYIPHWGWYNPMTREIVEDGPRPEREMTWFARRGDKAWGVSSEFENAIVAVWDMTSGQVAEICRIPDGHFFSVNLTSSGKIVAVNLYGEFFRFDGNTGALEISKRLPANSVGHVDCLCRIDKERLLGTSFITQRFWEINLRTGTGYDCGRAAPGRGEILQTWSVGGKVYMAAYAGGELVEYDPVEHPHFPENPRVVANPPVGMRPVAAAEDCRHLYYSCSHEYGHLGCVLIKYDTVSGISTHHDDPIPEQMIRSLCYDSETQSLLAGTTMEADCQTCPPASSLCYFTLIETHTLSVTEKYTAPEGTQLATVHGPMGHGKFLCTVSGNFAGDSRIRWFAASAANFHVPDWESMSFLPENAHSPISTGKPGLFIFVIGDRFELWDMVQQQQLLLLHQDSAAYHCFVQDNSVYLVTPKDVIVLEDCLSGYY